MNERMQKRVIIAALVVSIVVFAVFSYDFFRGVLGNQDTLERSTAEYMPAEYESRNQEFIPPNQSRIAQARDYLNLESSPIPEGEMGGGLAVWIAESTASGTLYFNAPQDFFTVTATNFGYAPLNLILKLFYNYEEANFYIAGTDTSDTEFLFELDAGYSVDVPVQLSRDLEASETISRLTVGLFNAPEYFVGNADEISDDLQFSPRINNAVINFEINYGFNDDLALDVEQFSPFDQSEFFGFSIHKSPASSEDGFLPIPRLPVVAQPGEEINLTLFANSRSSGEVFVGDTLLEPFLYDDFIVVAMLDWHQIPVSNKPFMWVNIEGTDPSFGQHVNFTIIASAEPGFYEFSAFLVPNPTQRISREHFYPLEIFPRFTIEVVCTD